MFEKIIKTDPMYFNYYYKCRCVICFLINKRINLKLYIFYIIFGY